MRRRTEKEDETPFMNLRSRQFSANSTIRQFATCSQQIKEIVIHRLFLIRIKKISIIKSAFSTSVDTQQTVKIAKIFFVLIARKFLAQSRYFSYFHLPMPTRMGLSLLICFLYLEQFQFQGTLQIYVLHSQQAR